MQTTGEKEAAVAGVDSSGRWPAGRSGNPRGRPKGSRNRGTALAAELLNGAGEAIVRKAIKLAKGGDGVALRLCVERLLPRMRAGVVPVDLPALERASDVAEACRQVINGAAAGELTLDEARRWLDLLEVQRRALETEDLAVRLELLEDAEAVRLSDAKRRGGL